jgi:hypothetical protein
MKRKAEWSKASGILNLSTEWIGRVQAELLVSAEVSTVKCSNDHNNFAVTPWDNLISGPYRNSGVQSAAFHRDGPG